MQAGATHGGGDLERAVQGARADRGQHKKYVGARVLVSLDTASAIYVSSYRYICFHILLYVSSSCDICLLILVVLCPDTAVYVICVCCVCDMCLLCM
jgi:hypothetical protein